ncbi:hypothetical protein [Iningainema tapete]|uniref:Uncharacterized protein n=1 Tax=Iningainema tapete BLCC-T55 TaxID=2748662 RepID=A0A8J6XUR1_9CYAN|nr:hypothetical protein [Iningainema tapete]MBD2776407.1 hypothetical protein [Iningainema tapete BLCC-T55]
MKFYTLLGLLTELDNLSLEELLEVKEKVDKLIQSKTSNVAVFGNITPPHRTGDYTDTKHPDHKNVEVFFFKGHYSGIAQDSDIVVSSINQVNDQNDMQALDSMIKLVDEWLQDDSGYDEEVYPLIEVGLIQD